MPSEADPLLPPKARADLAQVSRFMQGMLSAWIRRIINGQVDPSTIHDVIGSKWNPPWHWSEFAGYAIMFRFLSEEELQKRHLFAHQMLVARIVTVAHLAEVIEEQLAEEADHEAAEEAAEAAGQAKQAETDEPPPTV
jgi:hypothetical protein